MATCEKPQLKKIKHTKVERVRGWIAKTHRLANVVMPYDDESGHNNLPEPMTREEFFMLNQCLADKKISRRKYNQILVARNLRLAHSWAMKFKRSLPTMEFADIMAESAMSLMEVAKAFDPKRGFMFSTLATWALKNYLYKLCIAPHKDVRGEHTRVFTTVRSCTNVTVNQFQKNEEEKDPISLLEQPPESEGVWCKDDRALLLKCMATLSDREQDLIRYRYFGNGQISAADNGNNHYALTLSEVGDLLGVTKERVRQLEYRCIQKIKQAWLLHRGSLPNL